MSKTATRRVSLVEAADDHRLLNFRPHPRQRDLLGVIGSHEMTVCAAGRRSGKTRCAAAAALHNLLLVPELDGKVGPHEKRYAVSIAASQSQARVFLDHAAALVKASPVLRGELVEERADELEFRGGRVLAAFPTTARSTRGWACSLVCFDELAHMIDIEQGGPAVAGRLFAALTPSVAQFAPFGKVVAISTPWGENFFSELYHRAGSGEIPNAAAFTATTREMNPTIDEGWLETQRVALGEDDFAREFQAAFLSGAGAFFDSARVRECVGDWNELLPDDAETWVMALDPSFSADPTAVALVGRPRRHPSEAERLVVGYVQRWLPPKRKRKRGAYRTREESETVMSGILDEAAAVASRYRPQRVVSDQHLPGVVVEELRTRGVNVTIRPWTATSRTEAFQALRARVNTRRVELPDNGQLLAELARIRSKYRSGGSAVEVPKTGDGHQDLAVAVAAAVAEMERIGSGDPRQAVSFGGGGRIPGRDRSGIGDVPAYGSPL